MDFLACRDVDPDEVALMAVAIQLLELEQLKPNLRDLDIIDVVARGDVVNHARLDLARGHHDYRVCIGLGIDLDDASVPVIALSALAEWHLELGGCVRGDLAVEEFVGAAEVLHLPAHLLLVRELIGLDEVKHVWPAAIFEVLLGVVSVPSAVVAAGNVVLGRGPVILLVALLESAAALQGTAVGAVIVVVEDTDVDIVELRSVACALHDGIRTLQYIVNSSNIYIDKQAGYI